MGDTNYKLRYLPLFYRDLEEKIVYITETLRNPQAANDLLNDVENAIFERLPNAESFEPYHSARERCYKYYRIYVKNYFAIFITRNRDGITAENLSNILKRNDIKKSDAYQSGFLEGTTPTSDKIMEVRRFLYTISGTVIGQSKAKRRNGNTTAEINAKIIAVPPTISLIYATNCRRRLFY